MTIAADMAAGEASAQASRVQRQAADPRRSAWVAASAGSGKTKVLIDRLLNLLLDGTGPQRLLCLTFTKAAAAEMSTRLSQELADWSVLDKDALAARLEQLSGRHPGDERLAKARRLFAEVLDTPGGLKIQTIHAFAQSLLGRFPLEAGVPPGFVLADERAADALLVEAERAGVERARSGRDPLLSAALNLVADQGIAESVFRELLRGLLLQRARLTRAVDSAGGVDALLTRLHTLLGTKPGLKDRDLLIASCADRAFDRPALEAAAGMLASGSKTDRERAATILAWLRLSRDEPRADAWDDYRAAFLTDKGEIRKTLATKEIRERRPDAVAALAAEAGRVLAVEDRRRAQDTAHRTAALIRLAVVVVELYQHAKQARAQLDFEDLVEGARALLARPGVSAWVLFKLDGGLDHILVDEAQDTSPAQWEIVRALAEEFFAGQGVHEEWAPERPRTIFAVGDVKQSIFSFQGADPRGFTEARAHFANRVAEAGQGFRELSLGVSFRSTAPVLEAVDAVFASATANAGVAEIVRGVRQKVSHMAHRAGAAGRVECWPLVTPLEEAETEVWSPPVERFEWDSPVERLTRLLAERIRNWLDTGEPLAARGRPVRAGDIMVLVRRRGPFVTELVRALKAADIPVAGVDRLVLTDQMAVRDLIALGQAVLLPQDDLTLATVLKSPLVGLSEDDLFALCHDRSQPRVRDALRHLAASDARFAQAESLMTRWSAMADLLSPHDFFQEILTTQGGRRRLLARLGAECEDALDEFLAQALDFERDSPPCLQGFLHALIASDLEVKRELEGAAIDQVRVMTVHGAKGLQAPIVILPDTVRPAQLLDQVVWSGDGDADSDLPVWIGRRDSRDEKSAAVREVAERAVEEEYRRLLYVAMTRAEDRLIVCGWRGTRKMPDSAWYNLIRSGLREYADCREEEVPGFATPIEVLDSVQRDAVPVTAPPADPGPVPALPDWARRAAPDEPIPPRPLAPSRPATGEPEVRSPLGPDGGTRFRRGLLIHRLLQLLPDLPAENRRDAGRQVLLRPVNGIDAALGEEWLDEVLAVLEDATFAPVFAPGSRAEVPVTGVVDGPHGPSVVSGRIDRLAVTGNEVMIVDFKTHRPPPATIDAVADVYLRQMAVYRSLLASLYPNRTVRCALLWTDGPALMEVPEERQSGFGASP